VATVNPIHGINKPGSIGKPIPNVELSIRDEAGQELPVGATGEICMRGGNVMRGYWNQPEETAKVLRDGWLYTGDVGYRDAEGYYYITDRKKDMLLVNGINVYPREIEEVIYQFPGVKEAAVIGVPDARKGEQPVAFVAVAEGKLSKKRPSCNSCAANWPTTKCRNGWFSCRLCLETCWAKYLKPHFGNSRWHEASPRNNLLYLNGLSQCLLPVDSARQPPVSY
jgi:acyl-CoA synthetase (AMP-forming)/AMP-acid ligase II